MLTQKNENILQEIFDMKYTYNLRFHKRFNIVGSEARMIKHFPTGCKNFEAREWAVKLNIEAAEGNTLIGPFTLTDLIRLKRVINRSIKIVQNKDKHNTKLLWEK